MFLTKSAIFTFFLGLLATNHGPIRLGWESCSNCDIAWLYKDAHRFGLQVYQDLLGENVLCRDVIGLHAEVVFKPILEYHSRDFIELMESCPYTGNLSLIVY